MGRADGVTEAELEALAEYAGSLRFGERDRAALAYADAITRGNSVPGDLFDRVRAQFTEEEIVELTATITWEICAAKFNRALEIEAQGLCRIAGIIEPATDPD